MAQIVDAKGVPLKCPRCSQPFQPCFDQYIKCGCQDMLLEVTGGSTAREIRLEIPFRNMFVQLATLGLAARSLVQYIPGAPPMNFA